MHIPKARRSRVLLGVVDLTMSPQYKLSRPSAGPHCADFESYRPARSAFAEPPEKADLAPFEASRSSRAQLRAAAPLEAANAGGMREAPVATYRPALPPSSRGTSVHWRDKK